MLLVLTIEGNQKCASVISTRQRSKRVYPLRGSHASGVPRCVAARAIEADIACRTILGNFERDICLRSFCRVRIGQRPVAIGIHLAIDVVDVPPEHAAKVTLIHGCWPAGCARRSLAWH